jgi:flagellar biosynthetic protein FliR
MLAPLLQPLAVGFFLVLVRCTSLFMVAPIFSAKTIPALVRMGFSVPIAVAVFIGAGSPVFA